MLFLQEGASVLMTDLNETVLAKALEKVDKVVPNPAGKVATLVTDL